MKNSILRLSTALGLLFLSLPAVAMEAENPSFEAHEQRNPHKVLIVGCGHGTKYGHTHQNAWCVNLTMDPTFKGMSGYTPADFMKAVIPDEVLDITSLHLRIQKKNSKELAPVREIIPGHKNQVMNILGYKNTFDVVVLEQPGSDTLNKHWTLFNAAHMLKVGAKVMIVTCPGYESKLYEKKEGNRFSPLLSTNADEDQAFIAARSNTENISAALFPEFGIEKKDYQWNPDMAPLACFLHHWGFTDIFNTKNAHEPYTINPGNDIKTARENRILCATKTQDTENRMEQWAALLQSKDVFSMTR